jgi:hypothetical protein
MRTIALEEHFATPAFMDGPGRKLKQRAERTGDRLAKLIAELLDVGDGRVAAMDAAGVDVQALSLTAPGVEQLEGEEAKAIARETNVALAKAIERHPRRTRRGAASNSPLALRRRRPRPRRTTSPPARPPPPSSPPCTAPPRSRTRRRRPCGRARSVRA